MAKTFTCIKLALLLLILVRSGFSQEMTVTGTVTAADNGDALPGVTIVIRDKNIGTTSDASGTYTIAASPGDVLTVSFIGFKSQNVVVNQARVIDIVLESDVRTLDEVVVVGYGTQNRRDITGSVTSVKGDDLQGATAISFGDALRGKAAGVLVTSGSGEPGAGLNIKIRGTSSISASSSPLYVIDGVPVEGGGATANSFNPLSYLDPNSIESIEVLKDASAAAIYGSRGAGGVIIITTKSGAKDAGTHISFNSNYGISTFTGSIEMLNAVEYAAYMAEYRPGASLYRDQVTGEPIPYNASETVDWQNLMLQDAATQNYNLGLTSGKKEKSLYVGLGYTKTKGVVINSAFKRYSLVLNSNTEITPKLKLELRTNSGYTIRDGQISGQGEGASAGILNRMLTSRPVNANIEDAESDANFTNPYEWLTLTENRNSYFRSNVNAALSYSIRDNLTLKVSGGGYILSSKDKYFLSKQVVNSQNLNGEAELGNETQVNILNENTLNYHGRMGNHDIEALIGFTQQQNIGESFFLRVNDFTTETNRADAIQNALQVPEYNSDKTRWALLSYLGRATYSYKDKYILTSSVRIDGSSRFIGSNKYSVFPAFALGWQAGEEPFFRQITYLDQLKFRVGYGKIGNQGIPPYSALGRASSVYYYYGDTRVMGASYSSIPNQDLRWETSETYNAGIDVSLFRGRVDFTVDAYIKNTIDLLLDAPIAGSSGYQTIFQNVGSMRNKGLEISLSTVNVVRNKFNWSTDFNFSANRNTILDLGTQDNILLGVLPGSTDSPNILQEDSPVGSFYGYVFDGLYQPEDFEADGLTLKDGIPAFGVPEPGFMKFKDIGGADGTPDGVVDAYDRKIIGNANPTHFGGIGNRFSYGNFDLNIFFQWQYGNELLNWSRFFLSGRAANNLRRDIYTNMWTSTNTNTTVPTENDSQARGRTSTYYVEDASFIRLQNVTLRYRFGNKLLDKIGLSNADISLIGENLLVWTGYSGFDPEQTSIHSRNTGVDFFAYPRPRTVSVSLNVNL